MNILVIGSGYLGSEIKNTLKKSSIENLNIYSTRRPLSIDKNNPINNLIPLDITDPRTFDIIPQNTDIIIYSVSALDNSKESYENAYYLGLDNLINYLNKNLFRIKNFILISSTSVYSEDNGNVVDELSDLVSNESKSYSIVKGENLVRNNFINKSLILRLSGIYGPNREYLKKIALNLDKIDSDFPIYSNRIHKEDAASAVEFLIKNKSYGTYNISDQLVEEKYKVLNWIREKEGLNHLNINSSYKYNLERSNFKGKKISSDKLVREGFIFKYPSYRTGYENI